MMGVVLVLSLTISLWNFRAGAFSTLDLKHTTYVPFKRRMPMGLPPLRPYSCDYYLSATSGSTPSPETKIRQEDGSGQCLIPTGQSYSTLTLLEHMHLLTPDVHHHGGTSDESKNTIDFFVNTMGFGLDPKSVGSIEKESGENCFPYSTYHVEQLKLSGTMMPI